MDDIAPLWMTNFEAVLEKGACSSNFTILQNVGRGTNNSQSEDCIQKTKRALKSALGLDIRREGGRRDTWRRSLKSTT